MSIIIINNRKGSKVPISIIFINIIFSALDIHQNIVDQMINILRTESLIASVHENYAAFHADVDLMSSAITLLYNLAFEDNIFSLLKEKDFGEICTKLHTAKQRTIQFASQTLSTRLNENNIDEIFQKNNLDY